MQGKFGTKRSQVQILSPRPEKRCILNEYTAVFLCSRHRFCARAALHSVVWVTDWGTLGTKWGFWPWKSTSGRHRVVTQGECSCYPTWMKRYPAWMQLLPSVNEAVTQGRCSCSPERPRSGCCAADRRGCTGAWARFTVPACRCPARQLHPAGAAWPPQIPGRADEWHGHRRAAWYSHPHARGGWPRPPHRCWKQRAA